MADFLERQPDGSYEAADTKLARTSKPAHILQLCFYTEQLPRVLEPPHEFGVGDDAGHRAQPRRPRS